MQHFAFPVLLPQVIPVQFKCQDPNKGSWTKGQGRVKPEIGISGAVQRQIPDQGQYQGSESESGFRVWATRQSTNQAEVKARTSRKGSRSGHCIYRKPALLPGHVLERSLHLYRAGSQSGTMRLLPIRPLEGGLPIVCDPSGSMAVGHKLATAG